MKWNKLRNEKREGKRDEEEGRIKPFHIYTLGTRIIVNSGSNSNIIVPS